MGVVLRLMADHDIVPFLVALDPNVIDDLRHRLRSTRWPERETVYEVRSSFRSLRGA